MFLYLINIFENFRKFAHRNPYSVVVFACVLCTAVYTVLQQNNDNSVDHFKNRARKKKKAVSFEVTGINGLDNPSGTWCYTNGIVQALASCPSFCTWIKRITNQVTSSRNLPHSNASSNLRAKHVVNAPLIQELDNILCAVNSAGQCVASVEGLYATLMEHNWQISVGEHDCHEMLSVIFSTISSELFKVHSSLNTSSCIETPLLLNEGLFNNSSLLRRAVSCIDTESMYAAEQYAGCNNSFPGLTANNPRAMILSKFIPYSGTFASQLQCLVCAKKRPAQWASFDTLSLLLPNSCLPQAFTLENMLKAFTAPEIVEGVSCENCSLISKKPVKRAFSKRQTISKLPLVLVIHINRTMWLSEGDMPTKRTDPVYFPLVLNMTPYTYTYALNTAPSIAPFSLAPVVGLSDVLSSFLQDNSSFDRNLNYGNALNESDRQTINNTYSVQPPGSSKTEFLSSKLSVENGLNIDSDLTKTASDNSHKSINFCADQVVVSNQMQQTSNCNVKLGSQSDMSSYIADDKAMTKADDKTSSNLSINCDTSKNASEDWHELRSAGDLHSTSSGYQDDNTSVCVLNKQMIEKRLENPDEDLSNDNLSRNILGQENLVHVIDNICDNNVGNKSHLTDSSELIKDDVEELEADSDVITAEPDIQNSIDINTPTQANKTTFRKRFPASSKQSRSQDKLTQSLSRKDSNKYILRAVIVHNGSAVSGHFVTYRRGPGDSTQWYYASDSCVREARLEEVLLTVPYMLVYQRLERSRLNLGAELDTNAI